MKKKNSLIGKSISDYKSSLNTSRITIAALSVACVFLAYGTITKDRETIAVPPEFTEEIRIANNQANEHYKVRWAWSLASLAGNTNKDNAGFFIEQFRLMLSPYLRNEMTGMLKEEARMLQLRGVKQSFVIEDAIYDPVKDLVWVTGMRTMKTGSSEKTSRWTYEVRITARNGKPYVTHFNAYEGAPMVKDEEYQVTPNPFLSDQLQEAIRTTKPGEPIRVPTYEQPSAATPQEAMPEIDPEITQPSEDLEVEEKQ